MCAGCIPTRASLQRWPLQEPRGADAGRVLSQALPALFRLQPSAATSSPDPVDADPTKPTSQRGRELWDSRLPMTRRVGEPVVMLDHDVEWDAEADVVVVGSSVAGLSVAVNAARLGCETVVLEKAALIGGTARKVGAWFWLPNNRFMSEFGIEDSRDEALGYLARAAEPARFDPGHPTLGLEVWQFELFVAFCDNAARAMEALEAADALSFVAKPDVPNYYSHDPADLVPYGRVVMPALRSGEPADGLEFVRRMKEFLCHHNARMLTGHAVEGVIRSSEGALLGTRVRTAEGTVRIRARGGVVFCSGGFAHSDELRSTYLDGLLLPGCTASTNDGIFIEITRAMGVPLFNMHAALMSPVQLEWALERDPDWLMDFVTPGDSIITVNAMGERVLNEKTSYHDRSLAHLAFDVQRMSYANFALFSIWDQRTADLWAGREYGCVPSPDGDWCRVLKADSLQALADSLDARLQTLGSAAHGIRIDANFVPALEQTIARFNGFARSGKDEDFGRGDAPIDRFFHGDALGNPFPNLTMHPIADHGPYYATIIAPGAIDTKGGPRANAHGQILGADGEPVPGLYGVGNCVASPSGRAYLAGGATFGPFLTYGLLAAEHLAGISAKSAS